MRTSELEVEVLAAVASEPRMQILGWLKDPVANFPTQTDGDLVEDGVCSDFIREKLGLAASSTSRHLTVLSRAGLLIATRRRGWTFYRRDEAAIAAFTESLSRSL